MNTRMKNMKKVIMILLMLFFIIVIKSGAAAKTRQISNTYIETLAYTEETFGLTLWVNNNMPVNWWYNEQNGQYILFIPGSMTKRKPRLTFPGTNSIYIDGQKVTNGEQYHFTEGKHVLKTGEASDSPVYDLEVFYTSDIASLFLKTDSGTLDFIHASKDNSESGKMLVLGGDGHQYFEGTIETIHCRGNASFNETDKKSYSIKLDQKVDLFGMGASKKWVLIANAFDDTLLRNTTAFSIAKLLKLAYTPDAHYIDVYANGNFLGNYLLCEKIEVGKNRVNVQDLEEEIENLNGKLDPNSLEFFMEPQGRLFSTKGYRIENEAADITGGYLLELEMSDRYGLEASGFLTSRMQPVVFVSPEYASYDQVSYIANMYQDFEDAVFSEDGISPYTGAAYSDYIDIDSFARKYLLEELVKNLDASFTSQYIYKYNDSLSNKFFAGPCWDYDKSIAASGITLDGINLHDPEGLYAALQEKDSDIWYALYQHEDFRERVTKIFFYELNPRLRKKTDNILYLNRNLIKKSNDCNMIRWNTFPQLEELNLKQEMYNQKVDELAEFIYKRLDFLESEWGE